MDAVLDATAGRGADAVIDAVASDTTLDDALTCVRAGGTVSVVGVHDLQPYPLPVLMGLFRSVTLRMTTAPVHKTWKTLVPLVVNGRLRTDGIFTHRFSLSEAPQAYAAAAARSADVHQGVDAALNRRRCRRGQAAVRPCSTGEASSAADSASGPASRRPAAMSRPPTRRAGARCRCTLRRAERGPALSGEGRARREADAARSRSAILSPTICSAINGCIPTRPILRRTLDFVNNIPI